MTFCLVNLLFANHPRIFRLTKCIVSVAYDGFRCPSSSSLTLELLSSSNFSLCEVTVADGGIVKQRTLPDQLQNLAERIGLASRYYIKNKNSSESLLPDETVTDLVRPSTRS